MERLKVVREQATRLTSVEIARIPAILFALHSLQPEWAEGFADVRVIVGNVAALETGAASIRATASRHADC